MPANISADRLAELVEPGKLVYVAGSCGEPVAFVKALTDNPERTAGLKLLSTYIPGVNKFEIDKFHPSAQLSGLFMQPGLTAAQRDGRYRALPMSYAGFVRYVEDNVDVDLAVVQVAPPDANGRCSLGLAVEFMPGVLKKTRRVLGLINPRVPAIPGAFSIAYDSLDFVAEADTPMPLYVTDSDEATESIAANIAGLIPDGAAIQVGLGKVPAALSLLLRNHRNLKLHSGMLSDGFLDLADAGALDPEFLPTTCVLIGSQQLYDRLGQYDRLRVVGCDITHNLPVLLGLEKLTAVNSALEVDLFGQCNLELANGRAVSGVGGAADFSRAARLAKDGRSIVALNSSFNGGKASRIVPCLDAKALTSLARVDVDYIVTEFGIAKLRGASVHERARAIIDVAAPEFREQLGKAWDEIAQRL